MTQTVDRALSVLEIVAERPRRIAEIAEAIGVHHSTALRLLHTLRRHGFVFLMPDHHYRLGSAMFRLAAQALDAIDLRTVARPNMERLRDETGETTHLATLEDGRIIYVEKVEAKHPVRMHTYVGSAAPLHSTGVSKAILAYLPDAKRLALLETHDFARRTSNTLTTRDALERDFALVRERGYAIDDEENEPGIHCIAAPIFDAGRRVIGAISISSPISRVDRESLLAFVPNLLDVSEATSHALGWRGP